MTSEARDIVERQIDALRAAADNAYDAIDAERLSQAADTIERQAAALRWYAEQAAGCRKVTSEGNIARQALDEDGGKKARQALDPRP